jgi:hypothetical protein
MEVDDTIYNVDGDGDGGNASPGQGGGAFASPGQGGGAFASNKTPDNKRPNGAGRDQP